MNWYPHPHLNSSYNPILVYGWSKLPGDAECLAWLHVQGLRNQGMYTLKFFELPEPGPYHEIWGRGFRQTSRVWRAQNWDITAASEIRKILDWATDQFSPMSLMTSQLA